MYCIAVPSNSHIETDLYHSPMLRTRSIRRLRKSYCIGIIILAALEILVFNLPFWQTMRNSPMHVEISDIGSGLERHDDGTASITDPGQAWISINSPEIIDYLYINPSAQENAFNDVQWTLATKKTTDGDWYTATKTAGYSPKVSSSRYIHVAGLSTKVRLTYTAGKGSTIPIPSVTVNPRVPFHLDAVRLILEILVIAVILAFWPTSPLYNRRFDNSPLSVISVASLTTILCLVAAWFWAQSGGLHSPTGINRMPTGSYFDSDQYAHLAESLIHGRTYLDIPVSPDLQAMDNPYDWATRMNVAQSSKIPILFDVAFYNGKYYCYFGVLPAVLLFAPYRLITGHGLAAGYGIIVFAIAAIIAGSLLCVQLARLFQSRKHAVSLGTVLVACTCFFLGTGVAHNIEHQLFYPIPQLAAMFFILMAFIFWIQAKIHNLNKIYLALGSLSAAMTAGCRPQFTVATIAAIPLFWEEIVELWRNGLKNRMAFIQEISVWTVVLIPFVLGIAPFLLYNAARFGGLFDFGANYNLTGYDMTHHNLPLTLLMPLFFLYFLQPPSLSTAFPFVTTTQSPMPLWLPMQPSYGGFLLLFAPFAIPLLFNRVWKHCMKHNGLLAFAVGACAYALAIFLLDAHIVGYDIRYVLDFYWAIMIVVVAAIYALDNIGIPHQPHESEELQVSCGTRQISSSTSLASVTRTMMVVGIVVSMLLLFFKQFAGGIIGTTPLWEAESWFTFI